MPNGSDIIVRAGSAEVEFDPKTFPVDPTDDKKHKNTKKKITRVEITGDITLNRSDPNGLKCVITVHCEDK